MILRDLAPLYGLVLAGGQSKRMGQDKGSLHFHGCGQRIYCFKLLQQICHKVFLSCRHEQMQLLADFPKPSLLIPDLGQRIGPAGGLLAAHAFAPACAWLILACDFPFVDRNALLSLVVHRHCDRDAVGYLDPMTGMCQPLMTIWEPQALQLLATRVANNQYSPRKVLDELRYHTLTPSSPNLLLDVDTPQDMQRIQTCVDLDKT